MKVGKYKVIDDYFPQWMIDKVSDYMTRVPVKYDNTPRKDSFNECRYMGNMLLTRNKWNSKALPQSWFLEYLINVIKEDICKEYNITDTLRCLHNGQFPLESMNAINHRDSDDDRYITVIYMGHGKSGDTILCDNDGNDLHRITFKEGRLVIFNSYQLHRGEKPNEGYRCTWGLVFPLFNPNI